MDLPWQRRRAEGEGGEAEPRSGRSLFREYGEALAVALILALVIRTFVVQAFKIPSGSMLPTLKVGDHILVNKFSYGVHVPLTDWRFGTFGKPERGDVIVFVYPEDPKKDFIKRVIAVGGEEVEIRDKEIFVDGRPVDDAWGYWLEGNGGSDLERRDNFGPFEVPEGTVFVMGDNRDRSYDSRFWGAVDTGAIKGKAFLIYWSWDAARTWVRWTRLGSLIF